MARVLEKGDEGVRVFDKRGGEIDNEYLKEKVLDLLGDNVLYTTYVNI